MTSFQYQPPAVPGMPPAPSSVAPGADARYHLSHNAYEAHYGGETTAIVLEPDSVFYILNGDHRDGLEKASNDGGLDGVFQYFLDHIDEANKMSDHHAVAAGKDVYGSLRCSREVLGEDGLQRLRDATEAARLALEVDTTSDGFEP